MAADILLIKSKLHQNLFADRLFTGHFWHLQSGLNLAPFRAYDEELGRWLSEDPIGEDGGLNLYGYVENGPFGSADLLGLCPPPDPAGYGTWDYHWGHAKWMLTTKEGLMNLLFGGNGDPNIKGGTLPIGIGSGKPPNPQSVTKAIKTVNNILSKGIKPGPKGDIAGAVCDQVSNPVWNAAKGRWWDHTEDLGSMLRGLRNSLDVLKKSADPAAKAARAAAEKMIKDIEDAFHGLGL